MSVVSGHPGNLFVENAIALSCGRNNGNVNNLWLRDANGIPLNLSPWIIPFDCELVALSASTRQTESCDFDVYRQPFVRAGGTPGAGDRLTRVSLSGQDENFLDGLTISLSAGDGLGVFARGTGISNPRVILWLVRTS